MVLGKNRAKQQSPNPYGVRDGNSPAAEAICRLRSHGETCRPVRHRRQLAAAPRPAPARIESRLLPFPNARGLQQTRTDSMDDRIVVNETEARQATKEGVVRYILAISLVLVVVLFAVAYLLIH